MRKFFNSFEIKININIKPGMMGMKDMSVLTCLMQKLSEDTHLEYFISPLLKVQTGTATLDPSMANF